MIIFYLLLLFAPTQIGRHFFFDFSFISGIRSDYLTPTIYLTDIIALTVIGLGLTEYISNKPKARSAKSETIPNDQNSNDKNSFEHLKIRILNLFRISDFGFRIFLLVICYLLFNTLIIATYKWVALYKLVKIVEFVLLGFVIIQLKPKISAVLSILSIGVAYSSLIAIGQFIAQKSLGGIFWWLGERTFYAGTPGIAAMSYYGNLLLRPYATFPHPNVLGGFLAVMLPLMLFYSSSDPPIKSGVESRSSRRDGYRTVTRQARTIKFLWFLISFIIGLTALVLSFSRASWVVFGVGFIIVLLIKSSRFLYLIKKDSLVIIVFYILIFLSVVIPLILPITNNRSWLERSELARGAIKIISTQPLFGVGLNNSIIRQRELSPGFSGLHIYQPVHNIFLLVFSETGLVGFILFITGFLATYILAKKKTILFLALTQLLLLGLFDHYLLTLQQGQLLFTVFASLALIPRRV